MKNIAASFFIGLLFIFGCTEENSINTTSNPIISSVNPTVTYVMDTISIKGLNFLKDGNSTSLYLNNIEYNSKIQSISNTEIVFVSDSAFTDASLKVSVGEKESNEILLNIGKRPEFLTSLIVLDNFEMGSKTGFLDEQPIHSVELDGNIIVSQNEISKELWHLVIDSIALDGDLRFFPADSITWLKAIEFCNKLSEIDGLETAYDIDGPNVTWDTSSTGWRLPTEAEWEYICRAGTLEDFSGTGEITDMGWYDGNSGLKSHKMAMKEPNQFGLFDIHGNLWEWCWDKYSPDYYVVSPTYNPKGPDVGSRRVLRGGSFNVGLNYARSSNRQVNKMDLKSIGIRIVRYE